MLLELCGRNVRLNEAARAGVERRVASALGRFMGRVARVRVVLAAVNGPRGGTGKRCRAVADLMRAGRVVVEHRAADWAGAVAGAAERLARAVRRRLALRRRRRRVGGRASISGIAAQPHGKEVRHALSYL